MPWPNYILDPNQTGGEDFADIVLAESQIATDWTANQLGSTIVTLETRTGNDAQSDTVTIGPFSPEATPTSYLDIKPAAGHGHNGVIDAGYVLLSSRGFATALQINTQYTHTNELQLKNTNNSAGSLVAAGATGCVTENCIINWTGTGSRTGIALQAGAERAENCLIVFSAGGSMRGIQTFNGSLTNNTLIATGGASQDGVLTNGTTGTLKNNVVCGFSPDYTTASGGWGTSSNNASSDASATSEGVGTVVSVNYTTAAVDFVDPTTGDWKPHPSGNLDGAGTTPPLLALDITGATRNDPDDIGCYAIAGAGPAPAVLSDATTTDIAQTSATIGCTTDTAGGTMYWYVSTSATPPSIADHKSGAGAVSADNYVPILGANTVSATGLTAGTTYYHHHLQTTGDGDSNQLPSQSFETLPGAISVQMNQAVNADRGGDWGVQNPNAVQMAQVQQADRAGDWIPSISVAVQMNQAVQADRGGDWGVQNPNAVQMSQAVQADRAGDWTPTTDVAVQMRQALQADRAGDWTPIQDIAVQINQAVESTRARQWQVGGQPIFIQMNQALQADRAGDWIVQNPNQIQMSQAVEETAARAWTPDAPLAVLMNQAVSLDRAGNWRASFVQEIQMNQALEQDRAYSFTPYIATDTGEFSYFKPADYRGLYERVLLPLSQDIVLLLNNGTGFDRVLNVRAHVSRWREQDLVPNGPVQLGDLRLIIQAESLPLNQRPLDRADRVEIDGRAFGVIHWDQYTRTISDQIMAIEATVRG